MADLADAETGLTAGFRQAFADGHARLHVLIRRDQEKWDHPRVREVIANVDSIGPTGG